jgi:hypothetical protein
MAGTGLILQSTTGGSTGSALVLMSKRGDGCPNYFGPIDGVQSILDQQAGNLGNLCLLFLSCVFLAVWADLPA